MTRKRGNGEGSIRKRANGTWEARLTLPGGRRRSVYGASRQEVHQQFQAISTSIDHGESLEKESTTLEAFLTSWVEGCQGHVRPKTYKHYHDTVQRHLIPPLGHMRLCDLGPRDVEAMLTSATERGLSPRTVHHIRGVLLNALNQAMRWELVARNAAQLARPPKIPFRQVEPFRVAEARRILVAVVGTELEGPVTLGLVLGLRIGEVLGLRWTDIDWEAKTVRVGMALQYIEKGYILLQPKTDRSRRVLPMPPLVEHALRHRQVEQERHKREMAVAWREPIPGLVFTMPWGAPRDGLVVNKKLHKLLAGLGLEQRSFHALRHSAATLALASGIDLKTVSTLLGHSQISLTANTYASVVPQLQKEATDRLQALLGAPGPLEPQNQRLAGSRESLLGTTNVVKSV